MELLFQHSESLQKCNRCHSFLFPQQPTPNYAQRHLKSAYCAYSQQIKPTRRQQQDQSLFTLLVYRPASMWCSQGIRILRPSGTPNSYSCKPFPTISSFHLDGSQVFPHLPPLNHDPSHSYSTEEDVGLGFAPADTTALLSCRWLIPSAPRSASSDAQVSNGPCKARSVNVRPPRAADV